MSQLRFNTPPGWPVPPFDWVPPTGWRPEPHWPAAPEGWQFWVPAAPGTGSIAGPPPPGPDQPPVSPAIGVRPAHTHVQPPTGWRQPDGWPQPAAMFQPLTTPAPPAATPVVPAQPVSMPAPVNVPAQPLPTPAQVTPAGPAAPASFVDLTATTSGRGGLFGGKKRLEDENAELRRQVTTLLGLDPQLLAEQAATLRAEITDLHARQVRTQQDLERQAATLRAGITELHAERARVQLDLAELHKQVVTTTVTAELQEIGIYQTAHPLDNAVGYKERLSVLSDRIKEVARAGKAIDSTSDWTVNGSAAQGRRMVAETAKLMLRAYNAEADSCVARVRPHQLTSSLDRLDKVAGTIERLGRTMKIRISAEYHRLRYEEIKLTADYRAKQEQEKERAREERERLREERAAAAEFEREKARLTKEQAHYQAALAKLTAAGDTTAAAEMQDKLAAIEAAIAGVEAREANIRAGYVYVISNVGAFGPNVVKVGMTRRLEPEDRVRELGDASVPFKFDTHALIFSNDAVALEARLHAALTAERVNKVNPRREFFHASPARVRELLLAIEGQHLLEYTEEPEAAEWRQSTVNSAAPTP